MKILSRLWIFSLAFLMFSCASSPDSAELETLDQAEVEVQYETRDIQEYLVQEVLISLPDGRQESRKVYSYTPEGDLLSQEFYNSQDELEYSTQCILEDGFKVKENLYNNGSLLSYTEYAYQENQLSGESYFDSIGNFLSGSRFSYNPEGLKELWISLDANQAPVMKTRFSYEDSQLVRMDFLSPFDDSEGYTEYIWEGENWKEEISYDALGNVQKKIERTLQDGIPVEVTTYFGSRINRIQKNTYDERGLLVSVEVQNRSGRVLQLEAYTYQKFTRQIMVAVE